MMCKYLVFVIICDILFVQTAGKSAYNYDIDALQARKPDQQIHRIILSRTSPREMTGKTITDKQLATLFEAARWAPSSFNLQPWRFIYAKRNTSHWKKYLDLLWPGNQAWAKKAGALVIVVSNNLSVYKAEKSPIRSHSFDTGAAWMAMALEGTARGFVVHAMEGIHYDRVYEMLGVTNATHTVEVMIAIGKRPVKAQRKLRELPVSQRRPIKQFVYEGVFVNNDKD